MLQAQPSVVGCKPALEWATRFQTASVGILAQKNLTYSYMMVGCDFLLDIHRQEYKVYCLLGIKSVPIFVLHDNGVNPSAILKSIVH